MLYRLHEQVDPVLNHHAGHASESPMWSLVHYQRTHSNTAKIMIIVVLLQSLLTLAGVALYTPINYVATKDALFITCASFMKACLNFEFDPSKSLLVMPRPTALLCQICVQTWHLAKAKQAGW